MPLAIESSASADRLVLPQYTSDVYSQREDLQRLAAAWDAFEQPNLSPMQQSAWTLACHETWLQRTPARVVTEATDGELCGVAPLYLDRSVWPPRLAMIGVNKLHEPTDFVYADTVALERLVEQIVQLRKPILLERLPADSPTLSVLSKAIAGRGVMVVRPRATYPSITLSPTWLAPEQQLSAKRRSDLRRAYKRAEEYGPLNFQMVAPEPTEVTPGLDAAFEIEARSWKGEAGTALACDPLRADFFRRYAQAACEQGILRFCWLRYGNKLAAMQIAVELANRFWLLKVGYDEAFARCSPGNMLLCESIRQAARSGLVSYEFLGVSEAWTRVWTEQERGSVAVAIYPYSIAGLGRLAVDGATRAWEQLWSRACKR